MRRGRAPMVERVGVWLAVALWGASAEASPYVTHPSPKTEPAVRGAALANAPARANPPVPVGDPLPPRRLSASPTGPLADVQRAYAPDLNDPLRVDFKLGVSAVLQQGLPAAQPPILARDWPESRPSERGARRDPASGLERQRTVPEPASIVLLTTGLIGLAARRYLLRERR